MKDESYYLHKCIRLIEEKLQWGPSQQWLNSHFERLSTLITQTSGIYISRSTLKRLFGREKTYKAEYRPQEATKNALAVFLGHQNWESFLEVAREEPNQAVAPQPEEVVDSKAVRRPFWHYFAAAVFVFAVLAGILSAVFLPRNTVRFRGKNITGQAPLMAGFEYDVSQTRYQHFAIRSDLRSEAIRKQNHYYATQFSLPGFYKVQLLGDDRELASVNVTAFSKGWTPVFVQHDKADLLPQQGLEQNTSRLFFSPSQLNPVLFDTTQEYWINYRNIRNFGISADACTLECRLLSGSPRPRKDSSCFDLYDVRLDIIGEYGSGIVLFVHPQCLEYAQISFGEQFFSGLHHPLKVLGRDFSDWRKIRVETQEGRVRLYFEEQLIYQFRYHNPIGNIKGLHFTFKWTGGVDEVKLYNGQHQLVYEDSFEPAQPFIQRIVSQTK